MNEEFRKIPPMPLAPRAFTLAQPFETALSNGLKIVVFEDKRLPIISLRLIFRSGGSHDPKDSPGLTSALAAMLHEGTATRSSKQLAEEIEKIGATLSASAGADNTIVAASSLSENASKVLELMADMTLEPTFPEKELDLFKENTKEELKFQRSSPDFLAHEAMAMTLYGEHPYGVVSTNEKAVDSLTREILANFHQQVFIPNNATMVVVGDVDRESLLAELETRFGKWAEGEPMRAEFPAPPARTEKTLTIVDRPGSSQSNIVLSNLGITRNDPDFYALQVMNQILGAGASSRLFLNLREEKSYTYGAYSSLDARRLAGAFEATSEVRNEVTGAALKEFFLEFDRIRNEKVDEAELNDAKNYLTGVFPIRLETQEGLTNQIVTQQAYGLPAAYLREYRDKIAQVSAVDVQRVAQKYVTPDVMALAIVGDAGEILAQIEPYATKLSIVDTDGRPQNVDSYAKDAALPAANVAGNWSLTLDAGAQELAVTLELKQEDAKLTGALKSALVNGEISGGKVTGNKVAATIKTTFQGQDLNVIVNGNVDGDQMSGSLDLGIPGAPNLSFSGEREK
jgi:zinc protease